jgi:hypothetical protein
MVTSDQAAVLSFLRWLCEPIDPATQKARAIDAPCHPSVIRTEMPGLVEASLATWQGRSMGLTAAGRAALEQWEEAQCLAG